jgi:hypothetical protein
MNFKTPTAASIMIESILTIIGAGLKKLWLKSDLISMWLNNKKIRER